MAKGANYPKLQYIEIPEGDRPLEFQFNYLTPIIRCSRCQERFTVDPGRGTTGRPFPPWEADPSPPECTECIGNAFAEALEEGILETIENKLGLTERDRDALKDFIQTIFTDPKKILKVQDLDNRVAGLEKQNSSLWTAVTVSLALNAICIGAAVAIAIAILG